VHHFRELREPLATNEPRATNEKPTTTLIHFDLTRTVQLELTAPNVESTTREP
jgi:hypothetical protein